MGQNYSKGEDCFKKGQVTSKMCTYTNLIIYFLGTGVNTRNLRHISLNLKTIVGTSRLSVHELKHDTCLKITQTAKFCLCFITFIDVTW